MKLVPKYPETQSELNIACGTVNYNHNTGVQIFKLSSKAEDVQNLSSWKPSTFIWMEILTHILCPHY